MDQLQWGVIGLGRIVRTTMAPAMLANPNSKIVAVVSRDQARANAFAREVGARFAYADYGEMLTNPAITAVFIATPNSQHFEQVTKAAGAGKHVLCEKPIALSATDAAQELRACARAEVAFGVNFHNRQLPWVRDCRQMVADGVIGEVSTVQVEVGAGLVPPDDWRADPELAGLGTVFSQGVHAYDFLRFILGSDPVEVSAMFDNEGRWAVETQALAMLRFASGTAAFVNANQRSPFPRNDIVIHGAKGRIVGAGLTRSRIDGQLAVTSEAGERITVYPQPSGEAHRRSINDFTQAVLAGQRPEASGIDGLHSAILTDAMKRSAMERRVVDLDYSHLAGLDQS